MCGIAGIFGENCSPRQLELMLQALKHRGQDARGTYVNPARTAGLGHNRLSIIDLSDAGRQPMPDQSKSVWIAFNGEIYNYLELKHQLEGEYRFKTQTDTEVLLMAYLKWGTACLDRLIGMFAFIIWNEREQTVFAARDRFGVKPLYYRQKNGAFMIASEIKAFQDEDELEFNDKTWATYLTFGLHDHSEETFWRGVKSLPPGHFLLKKQNEWHISRWYDLPGNVGEEFDRRSEALVREEYFELMKESVRIRFRSDVAVGINLSGGVDSSSLLGTVQACQGTESNVKVFTFVTGDERYDELPWVRKMLEKTAHPLVVCELNAADVPALAADVQAYQDEPFGGIPTLAYARLFEQARATGTTVLLDGNGMDEQWAGYDYYLLPTQEQPQIVQGTTERPVKPNCLTSEFRSLAEPLELERAFSDELRNLQYRDARYIKIPRAMRFNDRISMRASTELREPFLDHRLFELALRQPPSRKIANGVQKKMLRQIARNFIPQGLSIAPKRALQTPQREWLRGELQHWANDLITEAVAKFGGSWLNRREVIKTWQSYCRGESDNSFYVWQWISLSLILRRNKTKHQILNPTQALTD